MIPLSYAEGGFYDGFYSYLDAKAFDCIEVSGQVFPRIETDRSEPKIYPDETYKALANIFVENVDHVKSIFHIGSPSRITRIKCAWIYSNVIIVRDEKGYYPLYETWRNIDRPHIPEGLMRAFHLELKRKNFGLSVDGGFVSSVGYKNYGHWLVDDLPRAVSMVENGCTHMIATSASRSIDDVRQQSIKVLRGGGVGTTFIDYDRPVFVENLTFCTPTTYHPAIKSKHALLAMKDQYQIFESGKERSL